MHGIGGEKDGEEANVNEVTYLISNELRLGVFNENVCVLFRPACEFVQLTEGEKGGRENKTDIRRGTE